jgi:predicted amidohydrolase
MKRHIRVASVQFEHVASAKDTNLATIQTFVEEAAEQDVDMIVFPECCITGYWHLRRLSRDDIATLSEPVFDGPSSIRVQALAMKHGVTVGAGLIEEHDGRFYNTYVVAMPDGTLARHRKLHAFVSAHIASGSDYTVFDTPHGCQVGVLICYDNNIAENARITALYGAHILLAPHQTGGCASRSPYAMKAIDPTLWHNRHRAPEAIENELRGSNGREWLLRWLPSRAHDNGMFLVFSNGVGYDDGEIRTGNAMILDPYGRIVVETCKAGDDMVVADLDLSLIDESTGRRWLKARRPELYTPLTQATGDEQSIRAVRFGDES